MDRRDFFKRAAPLAALAAVAAPLGIIAAQPTEVSDVVGGVIEAQGHRLTLQGLTIHGNLEIQGPCSGLVVRECIINPTPGQTAGIRIRSTPETILVKSPKAPAGNWRDVREYGPER